MTLPRLQRSQRRLAYLSDCVECDDRLSTLTRVNSCTMRTGERQALNDKEVNNTSACLTRLRVKFMLNKTRCSVCGLRNMTEIDKWFEHTASKTSSSSDIVVRTVPKTFHIDKYMSSFQKFQRTRFTSTTFSHYCTSFPTIDQQGQLKFDLSLYAR